MRWESLRSDAAAPVELPLGLPAAAPDRGSGRAGLAAPGPNPIEAGTDDAVAIEIRARSIINRVPGESRVPFRWTINPYRGCSHACVYCLAGDTPILLADGRTRPLAGLRTGDRVVGTERRGRYRRYVETEVLAHWRTTKFAYRVELTDGTSIVASGDHRFLTERGWKHVTGADQGRARRPHLTTGNSLLGVGALAEPPKDDADYRRGYVTGLVRGDGHPGTYRYERAGRRDGTVHRFRQALADLEALDRAEHHLADLGLTTHRFFYVEGGAGRRPMEAIRSSSEGTVAAVRALVSWPETPTASWCKGFLAGLFDAEGSCGRGILRFSNTDPDLLKTVEEALAYLGFRTVLERTRRTNGLCTVRLLGGLRERLRFFLTVDPAITRKRTITGTAIKSDAPLDVVAVTSLGLELPMYDITTGTGDFIANGVVSHNCFARKTHTYLDLDAGHDFDSKIVVKVNAGELARKELASPRWRGEAIAMGTNTDPYQRAEGRYRLTREVITALYERANPFSILTKGTLILRDLDLVVAASQQADVSVAVSVGSVDEELWRAVEPGAPSPRRRLDVVRRFADAGLGCSVLMAPVLPGLSDAPAQLERTVAAIAAAGATSVTPLLLHLRPGAREWYRAWLAREHPRLVPLYTGLYRGGSYAPQAYQKELTERVRKLAERHGLVRRDPGAFRTVGRPRDDGREPPPAVAEQLSF